MATPTTRAVVQEIQRTVGPTLQVQPGFRGIRAYNPADAAMSTNTSRANFDADGGYNFGYATMAREQDKSGISQEWASQNLLMGAGATDNSENKGKFGPETSQSIMLTADWANRLNQMRDQFDYNVTSTYFDVANGVDTTFTVNTLDAYPGIVGSFSENPDIRMYVGKKGSSWDGVVAMPNSQEQLQALQDGFQFGKCRIRNPLSKDPSHPGYMDFGGKTYWDVMTQILTGSVPGLTERDAQILVEDAIRCGLAAFMSQVARVGQDMDLSYMKNHLSEVIANGKNWYKRNMQSPDRENLGTVGAKSAFLRYGNKAYVGSEAGLNRNDPDAIRMLALDPNEWRNSVAQRAPDGSLIRPGNLHYQQGHAAYWERHGDSPYAFRDPATGARLAKNVSRSPEQLKQQGVCVIEASGPGVTGTTRFTRGAKKNKRTGRNAGLAPTYTSRCIQTPEGNVNLRSAGAGGRSVYTSVPTENTQLDRVRILPMQGKSVVNYVSDQDQMAAQTWNRDTGLDRGDFLSGDDIITQYNTDYENKLAETGHPEGMGRWRYQKTASATNKALESNFYLQGKDYKPSVSGRITAPGSRVGRPPLSPGGFPSPIGIPPGEELISFASPIYASPEGSPLARRTGRTARTAPAGRMGSPNF